MSSGMRDLTEEMSSEELYDILHNYTTEADYTFQPATLGANLQSEKFFASPRPRVSQTIPEHFTSPARMDGDNVGVSECAVTQKSPTDFTSNDFMQDPFTDHDYSTRAGLPVSDEVDFSFPYTSNDLFEAQDNQPLLGGLQKQSAYPSTLPRTRTYPTLTPQMQSAMNDALTAGPHNFEIMFSPTTNSGPPPNVLQTEPLVSNSASRYGPQYAPFVGEKDTAQAKFGISPDSLHSVGEVSSADECSLRSATNQSPWRPNKQNMVPKSSYGAPLSQTNPYNQKNPSSSSIDSNHSSQFRPTMPQVLGGLPASKSCPNLTFKKPASHLTQLQLVTEATFQPCMDTVEVDLRHISLEGQKVLSIDYRDSSWQGRSDEHKGWTPYVEFADFPKVKDMLWDMREAPKDHKPDTATIFNSIEEVEQWRETERQKVSQGYKSQDADDIPKTHEEKAAVVKLLFKAFKTTVESQSNPNVHKAFQNQTHSNAQVEAICWSLLEGAILRSMGGPLSSMYEPDREKSKSTIDNDCSFSSRIDNLIEALMWEKSVCVNLLQAPKYMDAVDSPNYTAKRTANNRSLNGKKAQIAALGKQKLREQNGHLDDYELGSSKAGRRSSKKDKRAKQEFDDDDDTQSTEEFPSKRHSPERNGHSILGPTNGLRSTHYNGYQNQITPGSSQMASYHTTPDLQFPSPAGSSSESIRRAVGSFEFNISQPNFARAPRSIPQSPLRQQAALAQVGGQMLPSPSPATYTNGFFAVTDNGSDYSF